MSLTLSKSGAVVHAVLTGELTVASAASIYGQLFAELDVDASLVVDAAGVTRLDTSVAQVFLFASRVVRDFRVEPCSAAWAMAWKSLGLPFVPSGPRHQD